MKKAGAKGRGGGASASKKRPKLGQNFLADRRAAERIVEALGDISDATVLEIGPGRGALTDPLAERAGRLITVELDRVLAAQLRMEYARRTNVEILEGDILEMDLEAIFRRHGPGGLAGLTPREPERARAVGNLPYYITSDILLRLFAAHALLERIVIMVQKEVADRIAAKPGTRDYGLLSATAQAHARVEKLFTLSPGAFSPPPKVYSTVLRLLIEPRFEALGVDAHGFDRYLKVSFAQKRKTLLNNLKAEYEERAVRAALEAARVRPDVRAEALSLEKAAAVYRELRGAD